MSLAVSINLLLFGLTAPFAAALMDRFGIAPGRRRRPHRWSRSAPAVAS